MNHGQKEYYKRDYAVAKAAGKPFFPYAVYKDLLIASLAIGIVIALAIWQRVEVGEPVNPASHRLRAAARVVLLLPLRAAEDLQGPERPDAGDHGDVHHPEHPHGAADPDPVHRPGPGAAHPTPADRPGHRGRRDLLPRVPDQQGAKAPEGLGAGGTLPLKGLDQDPAAQAGSELFLANGCTSCHTIAGVGAPGPGPNLTDEGTKGHPPEFYEGFLKDPPGNVMPNFTSFTPEQYQQLGTFLSGLGTKYT